MMQSYSRLLNQRRVFKTKCVGLPNGVKVNNFRSHTSVRQLKGAVVFSTIIIACFGSR